MSKPNIIIPIDFGKPMDIYTWAYKNLLLAQEITEDAEFEVLESVLPEIKTPA